MILVDRGVVTDTSPGTASEEFTRALVAAIAAHRHRHRPPTRH
ncbi:hypothetical protein [Streptomyces sp. MMG1533]|nr:hypothetical protein [Streptomyces sp. MMG1533]